MDRKTMTRNRTTDCLLAIAALAWALPGCQGASSPVEPEPTNIQSEPTNIQPEQTNVRSEQTNVRSEQTNVGAEQTTVGAEPASVKPLAEAVEPATTPVEPSGPLAIENAAYAQAAAYSAERGGLALVVIDGDRVALAIGQNEHAIDEAHPLHGASESFWGPVAVAAARDRLLDLDDLVASTIQEWKGMRWKDEMRIRQLLQYTSGLESGVWPLLRDRPANQYERALTLEMVAAPGQRFQVGPSHLAVFGEVLRRKLAPEGSDALQYLERRILDPIGLKIDHWDRDAAGNPELANGAQMAAGEWAKFGVLIRDGGSWHGAAVLEEEDVEACLQPGDVQPSFGLTFWLKTRASDSADSRRAAAQPPAVGEEDPGTVVMAAGAGNQRLYVLRSLNLVVARFGDDDRSWRDPEFLDLIRAAATSER
jgi:CubicO group peptidase (beta-lactamase class C family)